jgi:hypothetical protein
MLIVEAVLPSVGSTCSSGAGRKKAEDAVADEKRRESLHAAEEEESDRETPEVQTNRSGELSVILACFVDDRFEITINVHPCHYSSIY